MPPAASPPVTDGARGDMTAAGTSAAASGAGIQSLLRSRGILAGASIYHATLYGAEDVDWFFRQLASAGATATELFVVYSWDKYGKPGWPGWKVSPQLRVGARRDSSTAAFGRYQFPVYDLANPSPEALSLWRSTLSAAKAAGLTVFLRILDYVSIKPGKPDYPFNIRHYPFTGFSLQRDRREFTGGMYAKPELDPARPGRIGPFYSAMNGWLVDLLRETGVDAYLTIMNEADFPDLALGQATASQAIRAVAGLHDFFIADLVARGFPRERILISTERGYAVLASRGQVMEIHHVNSPVAFDRQVSRRGTRIFPNGDGPDPAAQGRRGSGTYREPSVGQAAAIGARLRTGPVRWYCYLLRGRLDYDPTFGLPQLRAGVAYDFLDALRSLTAEAAR